MLSMPISTAFSRPSATSRAFSRPTTVSLHAIRAVHSASGTRYHRTGSSMTTLSASPRKAVCTKVGSPSFTPTAVMASYRKIFSALRSTSLSRPSPSGCVWTHRTPLRRSAFRRSR